MNHVKKIIWLVLLIVVISGCKSETPNEDADQQEAVSENETSDTELFEEETAIVEKHFEKMIQSVDEEDIDTFLTFQNESNSLFYREQIRWFEESVYKRSIGDEIGLEITDIKLNDEDHGTIDIKVSMPLNDMEFENTGTYTIMKQDNGWVMDELPFEELQSGNISVLFTPNLKSTAENMMKLAEKIVAFYEQQFNWVPEEVVIKLYDSREQLLASIPFPQAAGWAEIGGSLKLSMDMEWNEKVFLSLLLHEFGHFMLADFTNDNASLYLQEGFASYLQGIVQEDENGVLFLANELDQEVIENALTVEGFEFKSIEELNNSDYNQGDDLYGLGLLLTNYLISTYGMDQFFLLADDLKNEEYIDQRGEHKFDITAERTTNSLEKIYKSIDELSEEYINYYSNQ